MIWSFINASKLAAGVLLLLTLSYSAPVRSQDTSTSPHLMLGNPSRATPIPANADNYLMIKPQYALSYSNRKKIPNWVSWQLNSAWLGDVRRQNDFRFDPDLPRSWYRVDGRDNFRGYDRGHMVPSADRTRSIEDNSATFLMTNIIPQSKDNNQETWRLLEEYCRRLVSQGEELYIISGGAGQKSTVGRGNVTIPATTWKVILVLERPGLTVGDVTTQTRTIAVSVPNDQGVSRSWRSYLTSVDQVESLTGYDFFSNVPPDIQKVIEARIDGQPDPIAPGLRYQPTLILIGVGIIATVTAGLVGYGLDRLRKRPALPEATPTARSTPPPQPTPPPKPTPPAVRSIPKPTPPVKPAPVPKPSKASTPAPRPGVRAIDRIEETLQRQADLAQTGEIIDPKAAELELELKILKLQLSDPAPDSKASERPPDSKPSS